MFGQNNQDNPVAPTNNAINAVPAATIPSAAIPTIMATAAPTPSIIEPPTAPVVAEAPTQITYDSSPAPTIDNPSRPFLSLDNSSPAETTVGPGNHVLDALKTWLNAGNNDSSVWIYGNSSTNGTGKLSFLYGNGISTISFDEIANAPFIQATISSVAPSIAPELKLEAGPVDSNLLAIKQEALEKLSPLVGKLEQSASEKFHTTMMMIQASDNQSLVQSAYDAAQQIPDEKERAQALLDVVNEINYFTQKNQK